jgi:hypothetical protein
MLTDLVFYTLMTADQIAHFYGLIGMFFYVYNADELTPESYLMGVNTDAQQMASPGHLLAETRYCQPQITHT